MIRRWLGTLPVLPLLALLSCGGAPRVRGEWLRTHTTPGGRTVRLMDHPGAETPAEADVLGPDPLPPRSRKGPRLGPGCRCMRRRCQRTVSAPDATTTPRLERCAIFDAAVRDCLVTSGASAGVVSITVDDSARATVLGLEADGGSGAEACLAALVKDRLPAGASDLTGETQYLWEAGP